MRKLHLLWLSVLFGLVALPFTPAGPASPAAAADPPPTGNVRNAAAWLSDQVTPEGFIEASFNPGQPDLGVTAQAAPALAAAGLGRNDVERIEDYLEAHVEDYVTVSGSDGPAQLAVLILGAVATGRDPRVFGGEDLVARLQATRQPSGRYGAQSPTFDGAFRQGLALWALDRVGVAADPSAIAWLKDQQCDSGGWTAFRADTTAPCPEVDPSTFAGPDTNSTALALLGLREQNALPTFNAQAFLQSVQTPSGGWAYLASPDQAADANSTALVLQSLSQVTGTTNAQGLAALKSFQVGCGAGTDPADRGGVAFQPQGGELFPDALATVQALPALAGRTIGEAADPLSFEDPRACVGAPTPNQRFVGSAFQDFLDRQPTESQVVGLAASLNNGSLSRGQLVLLLANSDERIGVLVNRLYQDTLGRPADPGGLAYWIDEIRSGRRTVAEVTANFYASPEYYNGFGGGTDPTWVTDLYNKLLGRQPDPSGLAYWTAETQAKGRVNVALRFFQSRESAEDRVTALYQELLGRNPDAGGLDYWAGRIVAEGDLVLAGNLAASTEYFNRAQVLYP